MNTNVIDKITKYYGYTYIIPCVCTFGILCNIVNLSVLASPRLKESPYTYLTSLAWFDLLTLLFTLTTTFSRGAWATSDANIEYYLKRLERLFFLPSANLFSALSIAVTVVLTIERYLFIKFPMHASSFCTPSNARRIVAALVFLVLFFRLPMYFFSDAIREPLSPTPSLNSTRFNNSSTSTLGKNTTVLFKVVIIKKHEQFHKPYFLTSFLLFEIVPFILLFAFNLNLVLLVKSSTKDLEVMEQEKSLRKYSKMSLGRTASTGGKQNHDSFRHSFETHSDHWMVAERTSMLSRGGSGNSNSMRSALAVMSLKNKNLYESKVEKRKRDQYKLTRTLITVVFFVLLSEISSIVTYDKIAEILVARHFKKLDYMGTYYKLQVFISNLIVLIVHSVNFFLYCAFNQKYLIIFKQKYLCLFNLVQRIKCKKNMNQEQII